MTDDLDRFLMQAQADEKENTMSTKPTYEELASAFEEYIACTNNDGDPVAPTEDEVERAIAFFERTGVPGTYYRTHGDGSPPAVGLQLS